MGIVSNVTNDAGLHFAAAIFLLSASVLVCHCIITPLPDDIFSRFRSSPDSLKYLLGLGALQYIRNLWCNVLAQGPCRALNIKNIDFQFSLAQAHVRASAHHGP